MPVCWTRSPVGTNDLVIRGVLFPDQHPEDSGDLAVSAAPDVLQKDHLFWILSDNATTVVYINHQGGTRRLATARVVDQILPLEELHFTAMSTWYIPGITNCQEDFLYRKHLDPREWSLHMGSRICLNSGGCRMWKSWPLYLTADWTGFSPDAGILQQK